jgi:hypothetical protein
LAQWYLGVAYRLQHQLVSIGSAGAWTFVREGKLFLQIVLQCKHLAIFLVLLTTLLAASKLRNSELILETSICTVLT